MKQGSQTAYTHGFGCLPLQKVGFGGKGLDDLQQIGGFMKSPLLKKRV